MILGGREEGKKILEDKKKIVFKTVLNSVIYFFVLQFFTFFSGSLICTFSGNSYCECSRKTSMKLNILPKLFKDSWASYRFIKPEDVQGRMLWLCKCLWSFQAYGCENV